MTQEDEKRAAANEALKLVRDGMILGIGTGSTVRYFIDGLADLVRAGVRLRGVATSVESERLARNAGISIESDYSGQIDLDVDGADEIDRDGNLIKGGGGALLREKIVAYNSKTVCIIVDSTKFKQRGLGDFRVPVEVIPYLKDMTRKQVEKLGGICIFRKNGDFITDNGNLVMDCDFGIIRNPAELETKIKMVPGVAEVGIFTGLTTLALISGTSGVETRRFRNSSP